MLPHEEIAVAFATALVERDFVRAQQFLDTELKKRFPPDALRDQFYGMFRCYAEGEPKRIHFDTEFSHVDWPAKLASDLGWAYVGIEGDDFVEAVTVTVAQAASAPVIREIEWGRP